jgi:4-amino-4-deoxy-L-arabinose transferase-like glycosyltransferase
MRALPGRPALQVLAAIAAVTAVKMLASAQVELTSLEAYYWLYGRHPAAGYFDHPAMIGWMVWLSTSLFGDSALGVRMVPLLGGSLGVWLTWLAGRRLYGDGAGRLAALLVAVVPMTFAYGAEATPDAPLLLFWSATMWALAHALSGGRPAWWLAAGVFLGGAMLSKYPGVFLAVGTLGFLLASPDHRGWLKRKEPYLAAIVALAVFSPTLGWNAQNGWQSLRYQGVGRFEESGGFKAKYLHQFPVSQLLYVTPIVCLWTWWAGLKVLARWRGSSWQDRLAASLGMPLLLFFLSLIFVRSVRGHWTAPAYAAALVLCAAAVERGGAWGRRLQWGSVAAVGAGLLLMPAVLMFVPREQMSPWAQLAAEVRKRKPGFVVGRDYHDAAQMAYHLRPVEGVDFTAVGRGGKSFPAWWRAERHAGRRAVLVYSPGDWPDAIDLVRQRFDRVGEPERVEVTRFGGRKEAFLLVTAEGYRAR